MTALEAVTQARGFTKGRRLYMKARRWRGDDWYRAWPSIAAEWESAAKAWSACG